MLRGGSQRSQPLSAPVVEESESSFKGADTQDYKDSIVLMAAHQSAERNLSMSSGAAMENADHQSEKRREATFHTCCLPRMNMHTYVQYHDRAK